MTPTPLTAEQRAAYKTRADEVQEIVREIEALEAARSCDALDVSVKAFKHWNTADELLSVSMVKRVLKLGIDTLIAQLEQQLVDLDVVGLTCQATGLSKPQVEQIVGAIEAAKSCFHPWCGLEGRPCIECATKQQQQIERFPVVSKQSPLLPTEAIRTAPCPYCNSPLRVSAEPYPPRKLSEVEIAELDEIAAEEVEATP